MIALLCKHYHYTPSQVLDMTWHEFFLLLDALESTEEDSNAGIRKIEERYRMSLMSPEVRELAEQARLKYGSC